MELLEVASFWLFCSVCALFTVCVSRKRGHTLCLSCHSTLTASCRQDPQGGHAVPGHEPCHLVQTQASHWLPVHLQDFIPNAKEALHTAIANFLNVYTCRKIRRYWVMSLSVLIFDIFVKVTDNQPVSGRPLPLEITNPKGPFGGLMSSRRTVPSEKVWMTRPTGRTILETTTSSTLRVL